MPQLSLTHSLSFRSIPSRGAKSSRQPLRLLRVIAIALVTALCANGVAYAAQPADTMPTPAQVKQLLTHRGVGKDVKVVRKDGSEVKGKIVSIGDDAVTVQAKNVSSATTIAFSDVGEVKGTGLSTGAKVGIGVGIGVVVVVGVIAIVVNHELSKPWNF